MNQKYVLSVLGGATVLYCIVVMAFVATTPDIRVRCLLGDGDRTDLQSQAVGVRIRSTPRLSGTDGVPPQAGDIAYELAGSRIRTFSDLTRTLVELRDFRPDPGGTLIVGSNPLDVINDSSSLARVEVGGAGEGVERFVKFRFLRDGVPIESWLLLHPQPASELGMTFLWFVLQMGVYAIAAIAYWNRPFDRSARLFFATCIVTLGAFVAGNHWWLISGSLLLSIPFIVAAVLQPAVLLHFFLVFPSPKQVLIKRPAVVLSAVYFVPAVTAVVFCGFATLSAVLSRDIGSTDAPTVVLDRLTDFATAGVLDLFRLGVYAYIGVAGLYFAVALLALLNSLRRATMSIHEANQVRWILRAGVIALFPIGYTLWLAIMHRDQFALGDAQAPMFLASLLFMIAYAVGIVRYRLMLLDELFSRGVRYYVATHSVTLLYGAMIAFLGVAVLRQNVSAFGQAVWATLVLMVSVIALGWLRARVQRVIDRRYFSEKYPLEQALRQVDRAASGLMEPASIGQGMVASCREISGSTWAALYLQDEDDSVFQLVASTGEADLPETINLTEADCDALSGGAFLQYVAGAASSPGQRMLRELRAGLLHGLEAESGIEGVVALGPKPKGAAFATEDAAFVAAVSRVTGVALHAARQLHEREAHIAEQQRRLAVLQRELTRTQTQPAQSAAEELKRGLIRGNSAAIRSVLQTVRKVAASDSTVLLRGESGTGKELLARAIHENSPRRERPLVSVHCAALAPTVLESELFGHVRGAFTDARSDNPGRFRMAEGGTLFLDEVGDIPLDIQVKLLRVLQERVIEPVGSGTPIAVDVRVVAATHQNLEQLIGEGRFREDLYYRLNVVSIGMPPLRERVEDIFELSLHFMTRASERTGRRITHIEDAALEKLTHFDWPGNIRQLQNVIERAVVLADGESLTVADLPADLTAAGPRRRPEPASLATTSASRSASSQTRPPDFSDDVERDVLADALRQAGGNKAQAARRLGMPRSTYYSKLKKYRIEG